MIIKYKVISVDEKTCSFVVRYYTDIVTEDILAVSRIDDQIARDQNGSPLHCSTDSNITYKQQTSKQLHDYIVSVAPKEQLQLKEKLITGQQNYTLEPVIALLNKEFTFEAEENERLLSDEEIDNLVEKYRMQNAGSN